MNDDAVIAALMMMLQSERCEFFDKLKDQFCLYCGSDDPNCQCMNDE